MQVNVWWLPYSDSSPLLPFYQRALVESVSSNAMNLLLDDIFEEERKRGGERASLLLLQLVTGANVILINKNGEALAMDAIWTVGSSAANDTEFARSCGLDTRKHTYPFKCKVIPLSRLIDDESPPFVTPSPALRTFGDCWTVQANHR